MAKNIYCDKKELSSELRKFKNTHKISEKLGKMFLDIATHYIRYTPCFIKYKSEHDDFIGEACHRMVSQAHKFDPDHPKANAFCYFTKVAHRSTITMIKKNIKRWEFNHQLHVSTLRALEHYNLFMLEDKTIINDKKED